MNYYSTLMPYGQNISTYGASIFIIITMMRAHIKFTPGHFKTTAWYATAFINEYTLTYCSTGEFTFTLHS